ncbi:MAG: TRAP transporter TatT component family protein [Desulfobacterales bacterium]|nr:MAG: TRAP transporter TatT component family protein [Desulfobacterales bacterium]
MRFCRNLIGILLPALLFFLPTACLPHKKLTVVSAATLLEEVAQASYRQSDLRVIREGMPAYLLLMDGMVEAWPDNERLLIGAAQGYSSYASAFVDDEDQDYGRALYARAKDYALRALEQRGLKRPRDGNLDVFTAALSDLGKKDIAYMFWAAACWGNWIGLNLGSMEALAELPRVELLMKKVLELDEGFYYGGPHLFMGILYGSRPKIAGGDLAKARAHFLKAIELGQGKFLMANIYYAANYARPAFDKALFISILQKTLKTPADEIPELTLLNTVAHHKAQKMLDQAEEYF